MQKFITKPKVYKRLEVLNVDRTYDLPRLNLNLANIKLMISAKKYFRKAKKRSSKGLYTSNKSITLATALYPILPLQLLPRPDLDKYLACFHVKIKKFLEEVFPITQTGLR
jgi:hypothetical protein